MIASEDSSPSPSISAPVATPASAVKETTARDRKEEREHNQLVRTLATDDGRALIWRILSFCNPYAANDKGTEYQRGIQEGQRRVANWIITLIERADSLGYAKMIEDDALRQARIAAEEQVIEQHAEKRKAAELANLSFWERSRRWIMRK